MASNSTAQTTRPPGIGDNGAWVNGVFYKLFFYRDNSGNERGPIDEGLLEALKLSGHLEKNTLIRQKNSAVWERLDGKPTNAPQVSVPKPSISIPAPTVSRGVTPNTVTEASVSTAGNMLLTVLGLGVGMFIIMCIVFGASNNNTSSSSRKYVSSSGQSYPAAPTPASTPYPTPESTPVPASTPTIPVYNPTPEPTTYSTPYTPPAYPASYSSGSSTGNDSGTYSVPHYASESHNFATRKARLDQEGRDLDVKKAQLYSLSNEIDRDRSYLDSTSQEAVNQFNAKVDNYNYLERQLKVKFAEFNREVDQYNLELEQVGRRR